MALISRLAINDTALDRKTVTRTCRRLGEGDECPEVDDGTGGPSIALDDGFDGILSDDNPPDRTGVPFPDRRRTGRRRATPIGEGNEEVAVEAMQRGAVDQPSKSAPESDTRCRIVIHAIDKNRLQTTWAEGPEKRQHPTLFDQVTGLGNRNLFELERPRAVLGVQPETPSFRLTLIDLNGAKTKSDRFGPAAGDASRATARRRLRTLTRTADASVRAAFSVAIMIGPPIVSVGVSVGLATDPRAASTARVLVQVADAARDEAKKHANGNGTAIGRVDDPPP